MTPAPLTYFWDGEAMAPLLRFKKIADKQFVVGEQYTLVVNEERSSASHKHYFAAITEAWRNLPENIAEEFPTAEHLRKYALIKAGFADKRSMFGANKAEAVRIAAFVKPIDPYALVTVSDCMVTVYTAQSQSMKAMGKKVFQGSKDAVLEICAAMVGVTKDSLSHEAGKAA